MSARNVPPPRQAVERVIAALCRHKGNKAAAAQETGVSVGSVKYWLRNSQRWFGIKYEPEKDEPGRIRVTVSAAQGIEPPRPPEAPRIRAFPSGRAVKVLAIGDAHDSPKLDKDRFHWMGRLAADARPEWIVQIGDFFTLDSLNSHDGNETLNGRAKPPFMEDMASAKEALDAFNTALPTDYMPNRHVTLGNHEARVWRYENEAPETAGMMQHELTSLLETAGWKWSRFGEWLFLGGVGFIHVPLNRLGRAYGGKTSENQIANDSVFDTVFGHSHISCRRRAPKIGPSQHITVLNLGCALPQGHVEDYAQHATTGWDYGAHLLTLSGGHIEADEFVSMAELARRYA
jgi:hypothetical protein